MRHYGAALLAVGVFTLLATPQARAQQGPYVGAAVGWDRASADYTKGIGLDVPPASYESATSDAQGGFSAVRATFGYRALVASRAYVSGEFEAGFHGGSGPAGYLREGTGVGDRDVWPGPWSIEKNLSLGANARLGYMPGGMLGAGGSVYFVTGVHWAQATLRRGSDIGGRSIRSTPSDEWLRPWVAGGGVEWGSANNRIGLEVRYSSADFEFDSGGDGSALGSPRIDHTHGLREVSVQVGYTRSF